MIDVALKVGELTGGMAEGSVVTFQTDEQPFSRHMKTVFALLRFNQDQLPLIRAAMHRGRRSHRRYRIPLRSLALALSRPDLERQWRSLDSVEPVNVSRLDLRKIMRRGYNVRKPKHPDLNAVSVGYYTVGRRASYADWNAVLADISTSVSGVLVFTQISDLSYAMAGATGQIALNSPDARIIFKSPSALKGNGGTGFLLEDTARTSIGLRIEAKATSENEDACIEIKDLFFKADSGATPGAPYPFIQVEGPFVNEQALFKIHDCILDGNDIKGHGISRVDAYQRFQVWNCKFKDFSDGRAIQSQAAGNDESFIENCTLRGNEYGIYLTVADNVKVNNCVSYVSSQKGFRLGSPQNSKGDNNISADSSANDFDGTGNLSGQSESALNAEFANVSTPTSPGYLRLEPTASLLPAAGKAPEIPDNAAGAVGNSRPDADGQYSVGADQLEEVFPDNWHLYTRLTVNAEKISGGSSFFMPILITEKAFMITDEVWTDSREDGGDLRISTNTAGTLLRPLEVVTWDRENRKCELWVLVEVDPNADTELYLWAGNPYAAQPEFNDSRDTRGMFYVWQGTFSKQGFVFHCRNNPQEKYAYDSSPYKAHAPINSSTMAQIDSPWGYGKALKFDEGLSRYLDFDDYYEFTDSETHGFVMIHIQKLDATACGLMNLNNNGGTKRRVMLEDKASTQGFSVTATAPDAGTSQTKDSDVLLSDLETHILGAVIDLPNDRIDAWVDGVKNSGSVTFGASNFSAGTHDPADIGNSLSGGPALFYGQEIRYWSSDYAGSSELDAFWQTHDTMIRQQAAFWSCGDLYGQSQVGPRKWQFMVPEVGCFGVENTDFWVEYTANIDGTLSAILHAVWDAGSGTGLIGVEKRAELEARLEELRHTFETLRGDLLIDEGASYEKLIRGVQLSAVSLKEGKTNAALDYDLTFIIGLAGLGMKSIARKIEFGGAVINAGNFLVEYAGADRTVFKEVFRAAPIRVPSGPVSKSVFVSAIVESIAAVTPLARRQKAEARVKQWAWDRLGAEGELKIDGVSLGTAHLAAVQPVNLELPDAVVFDLEFITDYGS